MEDARKSRNYSVDLIRIIAFCLVVTVHYFRNSGFYYESVSSAKMVIMTVVRNFAMMCVPLFLLLTGYLMSNKKLCKEYYKGIVRTLLVFVFSELICFFYDSMVFADKPFLKSLINLGTAHYSWYIDMYIGLFMIIPFLNIMYHAVTDKKKKQIMILSFAFITCVIPTVAGFLSTEQGRWHEFYPVVYYLMGCYIREYPPQRKSYKYLLISAFSILLISGIVCIISKNHILIRGMHTEYQSIFVFAASVSFFCFLIKPRMGFASSEIIKTLLERVSHLTLGAYLLSYIADDIVYELITVNLNINQVLLRYIFITVPLSIVFSLCLSYFVNLICDAVLLGINKIKRA